MLLAVLHVDEIWKPDREEEAKLVYGTTDRFHPGVAHLLDRTHPFYVGGRIEGLELPHHYDFRPLRLTPSELRAEFSRLGWRRVVAFQTRNPLHRAHQELTFRAAAQARASLLIPPVVRMTRPGDVDHYTRVRCYRAAQRHYPQNTAMLSLLPLAMRMGGPREAVWHAIIRKNVGHSTYTYDDLTALENLRFYWLMNSLPASSFREVGMALLRRVGIAHRSNDKAMVFSKGMRQRLAIARALINSPRVLLLDEPYSSLDQKGVEMLDQVLLEERAKGASVIIVTHDFGRISMLADRADLLLGGRISRSFGRDAIRGGHLESTYRASLEGVIT